MDHARVDIRQSTISCGVMELSRISSESTEGVLQAIGSHQYHPARGVPYTYAIFSDVAKDSPGATLADEIQKLDLGTVQETTPAENPKTGNIIKVWIWEFNHSAFKKHYYAERLKKLEEAKTRAAATS